MRTLDKKLVRDLQRMWGQSLAIALVVAAGVATLVLGTGTYSSLLETRQAYYERYRFADIFAEARRAPLHLTQEVARIDGIARVEARIKSYALLDLPGFDKPATGLVLSLQKNGNTALNALHLREGRLPARLSNTEVVVNEAFAKAHGYRPGATFGAILNGRKRQVMITGIVLSPEFIYALGPGDIMPDNRRFGIIWMNHRAAEAAFGLKGAFNDLSVKLLNGANAEEVVRRLDLVLKRYGGAGSFLRKDHVSHAFIDAELVQLRTISMIIPPIFIAVAAFLMNITLSRLIATERQQIGLMKALGYVTSSVALHYLKFAAIIAAVGVAIGYGSGIWLGRKTTELYAAVFQFPFLVFIHPPAVLLTAGLLSMAAALIGAFWALNRIVTLPPAVAMAPPAPTHYRRTYLERLGVFARLPQTHVMIARHILRFPWRSAMTVIGIASSGALLVMSFSIDDAIDEMTEVTFFQADRSDASLTFDDIRPVRTIEDIRQIPGVLKAEGQRSIAVTLRKGHCAKRVQIQGLPERHSLVQILGRNLGPMRLPSGGVAISEKLSELLQASLGDTVQAELMEGHRNTTTLRISEISQGYVGLQAFMPLEDLNRLSGMGRVITSANLLVDDNAWPELYEAVKSTPRVASIALLKSSMAAFKGTIQEHLNMITRIYVLLAMVITYGVVYNSTRISLSEHGRELASLRVLGFTLPEVSLILLGQTAVQVALAIPLSWVIGYAFTWYLLSSFETELYRVPIVIATSTYVYTTLIIILAAVSSSVFVWWRVRHLDLIAVLKTRE